MAQRITIIIVTYNAMKWAEKCFSSLRKSSVPVNVIVVDNGSNDGTQDYIKNNFSEVEFIQSNENLGFGKANNLGIEKAYKEGANLFHLMHQNPWIFEDSIQKMLDVYNEYPDKEKIGILSPMHLNERKKKLDLHFERYLARHTEFNRIFSGMFCDNLKDIYEINFVNAAHWLIPKSTIEEVGGFNPYFFHGAEDYDYINRTTFHGKKTIVCTKSKVVHDAIQNFRKTDPKDKLKNRRISLMMQRETRYLNPNYSFIPNNEKKEFYSNIIKLGLKGNFSESKFYLEQYQIFSKKFSEFESLRKIAITKKNAFLNL